MKKTISITLGGIIFNIEEDGYPKLKEYLDSIREYFSKIEDSQEIINDIEARLAEEFSEMINSGKQAVTLPDVEKVIESMGTVEDIAGEEKGREKAEKTQPKNPFWKDKKLYRDPDNAVIMGVAAGIANFLEIDPVFIRLAFIASLFFGGMGILLYFILCIIVPEAKTTSQKMKMHGQLINLSNLKEAAQEKLNIAKEKIPSTQPVRRFILAITPVVKKIVSLLFVLLGLAILFGTVAALIGIFFLFGNLLFNANSPYINFPEREFLSGIEYLFLVTAGFFIAFVPVICGLFIGLSLIRKNLMIRLSFGIALLMVWIISITTVGVLGTRLIGKHQEKIRSMESKEKIVSNYDFRDFDSISASGSHRLKIVKGEDFKVEASGHGNNFENLKIDQEGKTLKIDEKINYPKVCIFCADYSQPKDVTITMPDLEKYKGDEASKAEISGFNNENIELELNDSSKATAEIQTKNATVLVGNVSELTLKGTTNNFTAKVDDSSDLDATSFQAKNISIDVNNVSSARVWATEKLDVRGNNSSEIYYKGEPKITKKILDQSHLTKIN